jgi:hypothetical protein
MPPTSTEQHRCLTVPSPAYSPSTFISEPLADQRFFQKVDVKSWGLGLVWAQHFLNPHCEEADFYHGRI